MSRKYPQKVPRTKVIEMLSRGWTVPFGEYGGKVGYTLTAPDGEKISPEARPTASQAWDDILLD